MRERPELFDDIVIDGVVIGARKRGTPPPKTMTAGATTYRLVGYDPGRAEYASEEK